MNNHEIPHGIKTAIEFTEAYKKHEKDHIAIREAMCLKTQFPNVLLPIGEQDIFAGKCQYAPVGMHMSSSAGVCGYYCDKHAIKSELQKDGLPQELKDELTNLLFFWKDRTTYSVTKSMDANDADSSTGHFLSDDNRTGLSDENVMRMGVRSAGYSYRTSGINLNYGRLLTLGIQGLRESIHLHQNEGKDNEFYQGMLICLDLLSDVCLYYSKQAMDASFGSTGARKAELTVMSKTLENVSRNAPTDLREAIQLMWLYSLLAGTDNFGRMDVYLGGFYCNDIDNGKLRKEEADDLIVGCWKMMDSSINAWSGRIIVGGTGRPDPISADRFVFSAIDATKKVHGLLPQLTLRLYDGMDKELVDKALQAISEGCSSPMLYNDDVMVPSLMKTFGIGETEAMQYVLSDCGDFGIESQTAVFPNGTMNLAKILEITLRDGREPVSQIQTGLKTGEFVDFDSFDAFYEAFQSQVKHVVDHLCKRMVPFMNALSTTVPFLFSSMLFFDCMEKGVGLIDGAKYKGLYIEVYGNITVSDSLTAIRKLVFDEKRISPELLLKALSANFIGYEQVRQMLLSAPKYGNDQIEADDMAMMFHDFVCQTVKSYREPYQLDFCLADLINAGGHVDLGMKVLATPNGRLAYDTLTNANNPTIGMDRQGPTALLNSLAKLSSCDIGGVVQYLKLSKEILVKHTDMIKALFNSYFANGGSQLMITAVSRGELENAMKEPEKYQNLFVRVGGFNARYVELSKELQLEILGRTLIE